MQVPFAPLHGFVQELTAAALKLREADCMLCNQPGGLLAVFADTSSLRPTVGQKLA